MALDWCLTCTTGAPAWREVVQWLRGWREDHERAAAYRLPDEGLVPVLPFAVADYVDFYACEQHARNAGLIFRPDAEDPLTPNCASAPNSDRISGLLN